MEAVSLKKGPSLTDPNALIDDPLVLVNKAVFDLENVKRAMAGEERAKKRARYMFDSASARLVATHRAVISTDMLISESWAELTERLNMRGLTLSEEDGRMALFIANCGSRVGTAQDLGLPEDILRRRLGPCPYVVTSALSA